MADVTGQTPADVASLQVEAHQSYLHALGRLQDEPLRDGGELVHRVRQVRRRWHALAQRQRRPGAR